MKTNIRIAFIGGDKRSIEAVKNIAKNGADVSVWGIDESYFPSPSWCKSTCEEAVAGARAVVLPTPPSEDDVRVNCPLFSKESGIKLHKMLDMLPADTIVLGGRISPRIREYAAKRDIRIFDYFNREELLIKNAVPTAEGAIGISIEKTDCTLFGAKAAILGYGRIAEALALRLKALGTAVTIFARKPESVAKAQSEGYNGVKIEYIDGKCSLEKLADNYDLIYNTVPHWIVTEDIIKQIPKETVFIDLASAPGGVDLVAAKKYNYEIIRALALPAKTAPRSAGRIIAESIINIIEEELGI